MSYVIGILIFSVAQALAWTQNNAQFVWKWWENKPLTAALLVGVPAGMAFWYGTKYIVEHTGELWAARFLGFGASYLVFPLLTYYLAGESMFTPKTLMCTFLSFLIIAIQIFWK